MIFQSKHNFIIQHISYMFQVLTCWHHQDEPKYTKRSK